ncbi:two-component system, sensor histidine kinase [Microdochium nivale]|nr:two-component system, sensor histidine kinase [Microdochium nivale]
MELAPQPPSRPDYSSSESGSPPPPWPAFRSCFRGPADEGLPGSSPHAPRCPPLRHGSVVTSLSHRNLVPGLGSGSRTMPLPALPLPAAESLVAVPFGTAEVTDIAGQAAAPAEILGVRESVLGNCMVLHYAFEAAEPEGDKEKDDNGQITGLAHGGSVTTLEEWERGVDRAPCDGDPLAEGMVFLLVEDNLTVQKIMRTMMCFYGQEMDLAVNGQEAVTMYTGNPERYRFIMMDSSLPVMDGIRAAQQIRAFERGRSGGGDDGHGATASTTFKPRRAVVMAALGPAELAHRRMPKSPAAPSKDTTNTNDNDDLDSHDLQRQLLFDFAIEKTTLFRCLWALVLSGPETNLVLQYGAPTAAEARPYPLRRRARPYLDNGNDGDRDEKGTAAAAAAGCPRQRAVVRDIEARAQRYERDHGGKKTWPGHEGVMEIRVSVVTRPR